MINRNKTLIEIRKTQKQLDLTPNDLVYVVDEKTSKSATIEELINYFGKNVNLTREDGSLYIIAKQQDGSTPTLRYNSATKSWQFSNDGENFEELDAGAGVASEDTLGMVKISSSGGLEIDENGNLSINKDLIIPESVTFEYSDLLRSTYTEANGSFAKYSYTVNSIKLFEIIENYNGESYYIEPSSRSINSTKKTTTLNWVFSLTEDEAEDFYFKSCTWKVNFGR